jgi:hypothetical protein
VTRLALTIAFLAGLTLAAVLAARQGMAEVGLGLSLAKRVRELALGIPGILAWRFLEGHGWLQRRAATALTRDTGD